MTFEHEFEISIDDSAIAANGFDSNKNNLSKKEPRIVCEQDESSQDDIIKQAIIDGNKKST